MKGSKVVSLLIGLLFIISLFSGCALKTHLNQALPKTGSQNKAETHDKNQPEVSAPTIDINGLAINDQTCSGLGDEVTFTVLIHKAPNTVSALGFEIIYDKDTLEYQGYNKGNLAQGFDMFDVHHNKAGALRCGGIIAEGEIATGTSGALAELNFTIKRCKPISIKLINLTDDVDGWSVQPGHFTVYGQETTTESTAIGAPQAENIPETTQSIDLQHYTDLQHSTEGQADKHLSSEAQAGEAQAGEAQAGQSYSAVPNGSVVEKSAQNIGGQQTNQVAVEKKASQPPETVRSNNTGHKRAYHPVKALGNTGKVPSGQASNIPVPSGQASNIPVPSEQASNIPVPSEQASNIPVPSEQASNIPVPSEQASSQQPESPEQAAGGLLLINNQSCSVPGEEVTFTVYIDNASNKLETMGFEVKYDESILEYKGYTRGDLTQGFVMFDVAHSSANTLRIGGFNTAAIEQGSSGSLVELTFDLKECESTTLSLAELSDGLNNWASQSGQLLPN